MNRIAAAAAAAITATALTACTATPTKTPADLSAEASNRLAATAAQCESDVLATFGEVDAPARDIALTGCHAPTCGELATAIELAPARTRERRFADAAVPGMVARWESAGCRDVAARIEAAQ